MKLAAPEATLWLGVTVDITVVNLVNTCTSVTVSVRVLNPTRIGTSLISLSVTEVIKTSVTFEGSNKSVWLDSTDLVSIITGLTLVSY